MKVRGKVSRKKSLKKKCRSKSSNGVSAFDGGFPIVGIGASAGGLEFFEKIYVKKFPWQKLIPAATTPFAPNTLNKIILLIRFRTGHDN